MDVSVSLDMAALWKLAGSFALFCHAVMIRNKELAEYSIGSYLRQGSV